MKEKDRLVDIDNTKQKIRQVRENLQKLEKTQNDLISEYYAHKQEFQSAIEGKSKRIDNLKQMKETAKIKSSYGIDQVKESFDANANIINDKKAVKGKRILNEFTK